MAMEASLSVQFRGFRGEKAVCCSWISATETGRSPTPPWPGITLRVFAASREPCLQGWYEPPWEMTETRDSYSTGKTANAWFYSVLTQRRKGAKNCNNKRLNQELASTVAGWPTASAGSGFHHRGRRGRRGLQQQEMVGSGSRGWGGW